MSSVNEEEQEYVEGEGTGVQEDNIEKFNITQNSDCWNEQWLELHEKEWFIHYINAP